MLLESEFQINVIKMGQAINNDYIYTRYERVQLNPSRSQCLNSRNATFTLTNAVPMDRCFNQIHWSRWQFQMMDIIKKELETDGAATAYFVTGAIPKANIRIPLQEEFVHEKMEYERVTVPSHVWTALCYKHHTNDMKSFSLGYMGQNQLDSDINVMPVSKMNSVLEKQYGTSVKIFDDHCFSENMKSQEFASSLYNQVQPPGSLRHGIPPNILYIIETALKYTGKFLPQNSAAGNNSSVADVTITKYFDSAVTFFKMLEEMKYKDKTTCLLTRVIKPNDKLGKGNLLHVSKHIECRLVQEQSDVTVGRPNAADGSPCKDEPVLGHRCVCATESGYKGCCTSPCLYQEKLKGYRCYSGDTQIECSPQYSAITVKGQNCLINHPCATYGKDHYWCYTDSDIWDYCSPPLWQSITINGKSCRFNHACGTYDRSYHWCYVDNDSNWNYCCTHDDCFSAINGKICKPDHSCGYHNKGYLWCYTTDGKWEYCCKQCTE
ncbi:hypothetical protein P4O66_000825 [Electrophorus voltai]|uniref:DNA/RNA non-specific endonuclease/pyrophosphatase/phosphodiesterase domain-containing protein n=1 Tax=Electrophorus voltai TaxID=2609070 RepID=A0AAD8ZGG8_9TELE|nr:hypothetical protein P4O66_000825 [Electrophorus voltai]